MRGALEPRRNAPGADQLKRLLHCRCRTSGEIDGASANGLVRANAHDDSGALLLRIPVCGHHNGGDAGGNGHAQALRAADGFADGVPVVAAQHDEVVHGGGIGKHADDVADRNAGLDMHVGIAFQGGLTLLLERSRHGVGDGFDAYPGFIGDRLIDNRQHVHVVTDHASESHRPIKGATPAIAAVNAYQNASHCNS